MALTFVRTGELIHAQWSEFDNHSRMTGHGFRGIASTVLHEHGYPHEHIELQLAHQARNAVSAAYHYALYLEQRAAMMQWWADYLVRR